MNDNRNMILAIVLSLLVLLGWQYFVAGPQIEAERARQELAQQQQAGQIATSETPAADATGTPQTPGAVGTPQTPEASGLGTAQVAVADALESGPRIAIETPELSGSLNLLGGRLDDLSLNNYHETVDPESPKIVLFSPSGTDDAYYAEFGWVSGGNVAIDLPGSDTVWTQVGSGDLTPTSDVQVQWTNDQGLTFTRTYSVDEQWLFTIIDDVQNSTDAAVTIYPYGLVARHSRPPSQGFYILHEGMIGIFEQEGLEEIGYGSLEDDGTVTMAETPTGWLGITDKYWASALIPTEGVFKPRFFSGSTSTGKTTYQADFLGEPLVLQPGARSDNITRLFAGAKEVSAVDAYQKEFNIDRFDRLIDWGWFYFLTKPMFLALDFFFHLIGNFGVSILIVTVIVKIIFFPLANRAYASMSKMKKLQPAMLELRERYADDKMKQQQELMALYKKEQVNPISGCLPLLIQIPVFFALYKVLFVTIEMRHTPFFGWIVDLSAPDPTSIFNLFGLLPYEVPALLMIGVWPLIMGITMFVQMKLNPAPPDPTQQMIFNWMPVIFTVMLASFPAGLVIYWAWNNLLSVAQQAYIMRRHGVEVDILGNIKDTFKRKPNEEKQAGE